MKLLLLLCLQANPSEGVEFLQKLDATVPMDAVFRDESGRPVRLEECIGGRPSVLVLVYYDCPMLCTLVLNEMLHAFEKMEFTVGKEFNVVTSASIRRRRPRSPREEGELSAFVRAPGCRAGWRFLTGEEGSIRRLTEAVGFRYRHIPETGEFAHASGLVVLTPAAASPAISSGSTIRLAIFGCAGGGVPGRIGSPVDAFLLLCLHYDPTTGTYGLYIQNFIRLAA